MKTELEISKMIDSLIEAQKIESQEKPNDLNIVICGGDRIDAGISTLKWVMEE